MARALTLALRGWGRVHPNPLVGAVLLRDGEIVGEGAHLEFGGPHAEIHALQSAGDARDTTCVVTLEPCAHHGKTPPCADALVAAGVRRVVYATADPTHAGGGAHRLRQAGIVAERGPLGQTAATLNAPFFWHVQPRSRPWVALKLATSLDGFVADTGGRSRWVSGSVAREYVHWLRAGFDAIGVGRGTVDADDPQLTVRGSVQPRRPPRRVVFSRSGALGGDRTVTRTARDVPTTLTVRPEAASEVARRLRGFGIEVLPAGDAEAALGALTRTGVRTLLVEGGAGLAGSLLAADLVDRVYWIQAPLWLGDGLPGFRGVPTPLESAHRWTVVERRALGDDTLLVIDRRACSPGS